MDSDQDRQPPRSVEPRVEVDVVDDPIDLRSLVAWATTPSTGGVVSFLGTVRDHSAGLLDVVAIDYEVYVGPALDLLGAIAERSLETFAGVERVALVHRRGQVALGEPSVWVVVSAVHRRSAFEAASFCIDVIKEVLPVWKHEQTAHGQVVDPEGVPLIGLDAALENWIDRRAAGV